MRLVQSLLNSSDVLLPYGEITVQLLVIALQLLDKIGNLLRPGCLRNSLLLLLIVSSNYLLVHNLLDIVQQLEQRHAVSLDEFNCCVNLGDKLLIFSIVQLVDDICVLDYAPAV